MYSPSHRFIWSTSDEIRWHDPYEMPTNLAISRMVNRRFSCTNSFTLATWASSVDVDGRPERDPSSTISRPSLNILYHSNALDLDKHSSPKAFCSILCALEQEIPFTKFKTNSLFDRFRYHGIHRAHHKTRWPAGSCLSQFTRWNAACVSHLFVFSLIHMKPFDISMSVIMSVLLLYYDRSRMSKSKTKSKTNVTQIK